MKLPASLVQLDQRRTSHSACLLRDGRVLLAGGGGRATYEPTGQCHFDDPRSHVSAELVDPRARSSEPTGALSIPREAHHGISLADGSVVVIGGLADYG